MTLHPWIHMKKFRNKSVILESNCELIYSLLKWIIHKLIFPCNCHNFFFLWVTETHHILYPIFWDNRKNMFSEINFLAHPGQKTKLYRKQMHQCAVSEKIIELRFTLLLFTEVNICVSCYHILNNTKSFLLQKLQWLEDIL